jgi:hypothetical protein
MKQLLLETQPVCFVERGTTHSGLMRIFARRLSVTDTINANGRVYPKSIWQREIDRLQSKVAEGRLLGACDHPSDGKSRIADAAVKWTRIWLEGNETRGEGVILPTQKGNDLAALIHAGVTVDVSSRGYASTTRKMWQGKMADVINDDLRLDSFDLVLGASVQGAHIAMMEQTHNHRGERTMKLNSLEAYQRFTAGHSLLNCEIEDAPLKPLNQQRATIDERLEHERTLVFRAKVRDWQRQEEADSQRQPPPPELTNEQQELRHRAGLL